MVFDFSTGIQHAEILYGPYVTRLNSVFQATTGLQSVNIAAGQNIYHVSDCSSMYAHSDITNSFTTNIDYKYLSSMYGMFTDCNGLTQTVPMSVVDTTSNTHFSNMYSSCSNLVTINNIYTSNVVIARSVFDDCDSLLHIPNMSFPKCTDFYGFCGDSGGNAHVLQTVGVLETPLGENFTSMFRGQVNLTTIAEIDFSNAIDINDLFYNCPVLTSLTYTKPKGPSIINADFSFNKLGYTGILDFDLSSCSDPVSTFTESKSTKLIIGNLVMTGSNN